MSRLELNNVCKTYHNTQVIENFNVEIHSGEFVVLVGPSGCGKSTLLRMVAGLEEITAGEISISGTVVNKLPPKDRKIAMVFQNYALYPHMTVFDNMAYGLKMRKYKKDEIKQRVQEAAEILDLNKYLTRKPKALSGGQRQRVAMGRAMVRHPKVFLFDEPLSNLDAKLREQMRLEIKRVHQRLDTTSIYVTHDQVEAMTLADRIIVLNGGQIEQVGTPMEVYNNPQTKFVAGFMGTPTMNFVDAEVTNEGIQLSGKTVIAPTKDSLLNKTVTVGIRPENVCMSENSQVSMKVDIVELLGANILCYGFLTDNNQPFCALLPNDAQVKTGDTVPLAIKPEEIYLFDCESGKRTLLSS